MGVNMRKKDVVTKASQYQLSMSPTFSLATLAKKAVLPVPLPRFHRSIKNYPVLHPEHNLTRSTIQFLRLQIQDIAVLLDKMEATLHKMETMDRINIITLYSQALS
jgi:hypothetical protein